MHLVETILSALAAVVCFASPAVLQQGSTRHPLQGDVPPRAPRRPRPPTRLARRRRPHGPRLRHRDPRPRARQRDPGRGRHRHRARLRPRHRGKPCRSTSEASGTDRHELRRRRVSAFLAAAGPGARRIAPAPSVRPGCWRSCPARPPWGRSSLSSSLPVIDACEPVVAVVIEGALVREHVSLAAGALAAELLGAAALVGVFTLGRSPTRGRPPTRREEALAGPRSEPRPVVPSQPAHRPSPLSGQVALRLV